MLASPEPLITSRCQAGQRPCPFRSRRLLRAPDAQQPPHRLQQSTPNPAADRSPLGNDHRRRAILVRTGCQPQRMEPDLVIGAVGVQHDQSRLQAVGTRDLQGDRQVRVLPTHHDPVRARNSRRGAYLPLPDAIPGQPTAGPESVGQHLLGSWGEPQRPLKPSANPRAVCSDGSRIAVLRHDGALPGYPST